MSSPKMILYVEPMQTHLKFALTFKNNTEETVLIRGAVEAFSDLKHLKFFMQPCEVLINCGYDSANVKAFSEAHGIPYPATIEQRLRIAQFTQNIPQ